VKSPARPAIALAHAGYLIEPVAPQASRSWPVTVTKPSIVCQKWSVTHSGVPVRLRQTSTKLS
jgi:hypothetical protein